MNTIMNQVATPCLMSEMELEEILLFPSCARNILKNIDRSLSDGYIDQGQVTRLLTFRWMIMQGLK